MLKSKNLLLVSIAFVLGAASQGLMPNRTSFADPPTEPASVKSPPVNPATVTPSTLKVKEIPKLQVARLGVLGAEARGFTSQTVGEALLITPKGPHFFVGAFQPTEQPKLGALSVKPDQAVVIGRLFVRDGDDLIPCEVDPDGGTSLPGCTAPDLPPLPPLPIVGCIGGDKNRASRCAESF